MTPNTRVTGSPPAQKRGGGFRPDIEGMRAVAVAAVVLFHANVPGITGGYVGVDVFFVISGFLITGMLWREAGSTGTVSLRRFYGARARRLLPASATVGIVTMIASALLLPPLQVKTVSIDAITSALYVSNYWFVTTGINYFSKDSLAVPSPFQHYWSLGVEEQFYLVWPLLIIVTAWVIRRVRRLATRPEATASERPYLAVLVIVAVVSFALSLVLTYVLPPVAYFSLPTRAWQLATGGLVAFTVMHWRRLPPIPAAVLSWIGLALILVACFGLSSTTHYPGAAALLPTVGAALIIGAGCAESPHGCRRLLELPLMGALGRVSYSLYLWHWPVIVLAPVVVGHPLELPARLVTVAISVVLAVLTLKFIENPLRFADRIRNSPGNSLTLGGVATAAAVAVGVVPLIAVPIPVGRGPAAPPLNFTAAAVPPGSPMSAYDAAVQNVFAQMQATISASLEMKAAPSNLTPPLTDLAGQLKSMLSGGCMRIMPFDGSHPECAVGDTTSKTTVALIGDSHAAVLNPAFQRIADERRWRLLMFSKAACPIVDLPLTNQFNGLAEEFQRCAEWRSTITARLDSERPRLIVVSPSRQYSGDGTAIWGYPGFRPYDSAWIDGLKRLTERLRATGAQVLVLGPVPTSPVFLPTCLSAHLDDVSKCIFQLDNSNRGPGMAAERSAIEAASGQYASLDELFCSDNRCPAIVDNTVVFSDGSHMTRQYTLQLAPALGALADRALARG